MNKAEVNFLEHLNSQKSLRFEITTSTCNRTQPATDYQLYQQYFSILKRPFGNYNFIFCPDFGGNSHWYSPLGKSPKKPVSHGAIRYDNIDLQPDKNGHNILVSC